MQDIVREGFKFRQRVRIPCYDTDAAFRLKPAAFLDLCQEIAYWAAQELGFGYDALQEHHTAWVLSRIHFHYACPPRWRDTVDLHTWHKGSDGLFFLRDFRLCDPDGTELACCTSSWLVLDVETRRLVRPDTLTGLQLPFASAQDTLLNPASAAANLPEHAIAEPSPKIQLPRDAEPEPAGEHVVGYSDIDILGHTNNARYLVWAMDCLPYPLASARPVQDVYINYNKETVPGDTVVLSRLCREDACFVEGKVDGKSVFTAKLVF